MTETEAELRAALAALTKQIEVLQARLDHARLAEAPTMRRQLRCPACGGRRIAHAQHVLDRDDGERKAMALNQPSWWSEKVVGELEAYACTGCGLVEWYVKDPAALRDVPERITIVDADTDTGPYR